MIQCFMLYRRQTCQSVHTTFFFRTTAPSTSKWISVTPVVRHSRRRWSRRSLELILYSRIAIWRWSWGRSIALTWRCVCLIGCSLRCARRSLVSRWSRRVRVVHWRRRLTVHSVVFGAVCVVAGRVGFVGIGRVDTGKIAAADKPLLKIG